jgi:hypothetical protein
MKYEKEINEKLHPHQITSHYAKFIEAIKES